MPSLLEHTIYGMFDLFIRFDHSMLNPLSCATNVNTTGIHKFNTDPAGWPYLHSLGQDYASHSALSQWYSCQRIMHILYYLLENDKYKTIPENSENCQFMWEHLQNINCVVQRIKHARRTFNVKKCTIAALKVTIWAMCAVSKEALLIPLKFRRSRIGLHLKTWPMSEHF